MNVKFATCLATLLAFLALTACNATKARINDNAELFETYPLEVQALIKANRIDRGFDQTQVYMAMGNADRTELVNGEEHWYFHASHSNTVREEKSARDYRDELLAYEKARAAGRKVPEPKTYRIIKLRRNRVARIVKFVEGQVDSWEEPEEMWLDEWH